MNYIILKSEADNSTLLLEEKSITFTASLYRIETAPFP